MKDRFVIFDLDNTHSPRTYAERVVRHIGLKPHRLVCWHDLQGQKKPSPKGYKTACAGLQVGACGMAVGDEIHDLRAADAFGCTACFAGWCRNPNLTKADCKKEGWQYVAQPGDLAKLVRELL